MTAHSMHSVGVNQDGSPIFYSHGNGYMQTILTGRGDPKAATENSGLLLKTEVGCGLDPVEGSILSDEVDDWLIGVAGDGSGGIGVLVLINEDSALRVGPGFRNEIEGESVEVDALIVGNICDDDDDSP